MPSMKEILETALLGNHIGEGSRAFVYPHPTDPEKLVKVSREADALIKNNRLGNQLEIPAVPNPVPKRNYGQPTHATYFEGSAEPDLAILPKVPGKQHKSIFSFENNESLLKKHLEHLASIPQEEYTKLRRDYKIGSNVMGYEPDAHPGNLLIEGKKLNPIDMGLDNLENQRSTTMWKNMSKKEKNQIMETAIFGSVRKPAKNKIVRTVPEGRGLYKQILGKLRVASKVVPAVSVPFQVLDAKSLLKNIKQKGTDAGYADWLGLQTRDSAEGI